MARKKYWSKLAETEFLSVLARTANVSAASRSAGITRTRLYERRLKCEAFAAAWQAALEEALDDLEGELRRRAMDGVEKPIFYGGKQCGIQKNYSDNLGMFLLKARRREIFADSARGGGAPEAPPSTLAREALIDKLGTIRDNLSDVAGEPARNG